MALIFPILTQFDDRAAKKADKTFGALGRKFAAVFSVAAVAKFGKASVRAFMEAEKEAAQLRATLEAVNLGFASPLINEYIDNLELLSGKSGGELTRAFTSLSQATGDATTAQELLNLSLDVAAGTGKDLTTVASALQRAFKGETTALARLRIGYTTAELKGKDFADVVEDLQKKFEGAGAAAADTFAGKIARLRGAVEQAQEAFGEGFVRELENANVSIEELQKGIINLGEALGTTAAAFTGFASDAVDAMEAIRDNPATQAVLDVFDALTRGIGFIVTGELVPTMDQADARRAGEERRKNEVANRATLRQRAALSRAEKKISAERDKQLKLSEREKKFQAQLDKAKKMFDMEQIQIQAALQGKITEEERTRLKLMQAILDENGSEAERLTEKLKQLQSDTERLANTLVSLKAGDPFDNWNDYFSSAGKLIDDLFKKMSALAASTDALMAQSQTRQAQAQANFMSALENRAQAYAEAARATSVSADIARSQSASAQQEALQAIAGARTPEELAAAQEFKRAADAAADAAAVLTDSVSAAQEAAALAALREAQALEQEATSGLISMGIAPVTVNITVEGNAITQDDLVDYVQTGLYTAQKSGKGLLYSAVAI